MYKDTCSDMQWHTIASRTSLCCSRARSVFNLKSMNTRPFLLSVFLMACMVVAAQPQFSRPHGLYNQSSLVVSMTSSDTEAQIYYTTDGSEPTPQSKKYLAPITLAKTTILRAVEVKGDTLSSPISTASYIFVSSVLNQSNTPAGYPSTWGNYTQISGTAKADYEMDPELTGNSTLRSKIIQGLRDLPILSIASDKDNFFSHERDSVRGGIYIFTGPPVGDATGHGWTRPASVELMGGPQGHDLTTSCGVRLHGGHGRLAEKNPKHSFRLVFKEQYGPKTLQYPVFGDDAPTKFDQLVLRCHFGNSWQHWSDAGRQKAQYARDVWARRMQRKMGHTAVDALYVHLFLNGMYWGLYNIAERVDDQFGKDHLGGKKSDIDVVKIEESGGNHIEASEGDLDAYEQMVATAKRAADDTYYYRLQGLDSDGNDDPEQETLLDIDAFIDYMLINQYGGNTDWDHHNWYALRRRGPESQGFRFLCWDTEQIFENPTDNVLALNNGDRFPTGIFNNLLRNQQFARRYKRRARQLLAADGWLGHDSVVQLWDSLYNTISTAIYDESARWGDYRRDVHRYSSAGQLYTPDNHYQAERQRLLTQYFPDRSGRVLNNILNLVNIDDWEAPDHWIPMTASMFHEWDGTDAHAMPLDTPVSVDWNLGQDMGGGYAIAGFVNVEHTRYADLSRYDKLVLRGSGNGLRILANRLVDHGPWKQFIVNFNDADPNWDDTHQAIVFPLASLKTCPTNQGVTRIDDFVHLNALKVDWGCTLNVSGIYLVPYTDSTSVSRVSPVLAHDGAYYNLNGQRVAHPSSGLYIKDGKKVFLRGRRQR